MVVEKGTKIGKIFNIEHYIDVLKLAKHREGIKNNFFQTKLIADFSYKDFKGTVPLLTHEKNLEPNLVIFVPFLLLWSSKGGPWGVK